MIRRTFHVVGAIILVMFFGATIYASKELMVKVERPLIPKPDQALIVFMRPQPSSGRAFWTGDFNQLISIHDVSGNEPKLIGLLSKGTKISYDIAPGEYTFMVVGEAADFMKATVSAGKTYYAALWPRVGVWKARFSFQPLRQPDLASADFASWDSGTYLIDNTPESMEWAKKNAADIEKKRARYWPDWINLPVEERDAMTLKLEDGR